MVVSVGGRVQLLLRWQQLLGSGCQEGHELGLIWDRLNSQALEAADWLGNDVKDVFLASNEGVGEGSCNGETRRRVVEAVEKTKSLLLTSFLELHRPRKARHVWAWRQRDKIACSWLLALPGPDTLLTSDQFSEAAAANLCLPSPACEGRVGEVIRGRVKIDQYGDNIQSTNIGVDHWRDMT